MFYTFTFQMCTRNQTSQKLGVVGDWGFKNSFRQCSNFAKFLYFFPWRNFVNFCISYNHANLEISSFCEMRKSREIELILSQYFCSLCHRLPSLVLLIKHFWERSSSMNLFVCKWVTKRLTN